MWLDIIKRDYGIYSRSLAIAEGRDKKERGKEKEKEKIDEHENEDDRKGEKKGDE